MRRISLLSLVLAGCPDQGLTKFNSLPEAQILSPALGDLVVEGDTLALRGSVSDANHDAYELSVAWYSGDTTICEPAAPAEDGSTSCEWVADTLGQALRLEVLDLEGAAGEDSVTLDVVPNEAPTAAIVSPTSEATLYAGALIELDGMGADAESAISALSATWTSSLDGALAVDPALDADGHHRGAVTLSEGEHYLTFTVSDPQGKEATDTLIATVGPPDTAPDCTIDLPLDGESAPYGTTVSFVATVYDAEEAAEGLDVAWSSDLDGSLGSSTPASDGSVTWSTDSLSIGAHTVSLTVTDAAGVTCGDNVTVEVTSGPTVTIVAPADGGVAIAGESVAFEATVSDAEDVASALLLDWESDIDGVLSTAPADSAGRSAFTTRDLSPGLHTLTLIATDSDAVYTTASVTLLVDEVPSAPEVSLAPDPAWTDDDLVATIGVASVDPEGDMVSYRYDWYVDGVLSGASTTATLPASATTRGQTWTLVLTPNDGFGDGASGSAALTIEDTAPEVSALTLSPSPAVTNDTLSAAITSSDLDGDSVSHTYAWTVDGVAAGTSAPLDGSAFSKHQEVALAVTPSDGITIGSAFTSAPLTIDNSTPGAPLAVLDPASPAEGAAPLVCTVAVDADDADGDTLDYTVTWTVDGAPFTGTVTTYWPDDTVPAAVQLEGEVWTCTLTADDGEGPGPSATATATVAACPYGASVLCPATSCVDALDAGASVGDGTYQVDPGTGAVEVYCDMTTDGGGWTLVAVVSDDGTDTWTYARRRYWDTDSATFGALTALDHDYKSSALHDLAFRDVLFAHEPSGVWGAYDDVGDGTMSLAEVIAGYGDEYCYHGSSRGFASSAGSVATGGQLCEDALYFNAADHDGTGSCSCSSCGEDAYGPAWSTDIGDGCPFDDPGPAGALGPDGSATTTESAALGFAAPLGLNTGAPGAAENHMWVLVR